MAIYFTPPTQAQRYVLDHLAGLWIEGSVGITVIKEGSAYRQVRSPSQQELEAATAYYLGGHRYEITAAEQSDLTAAGYGAYIVTT